ncbi:hypothetical protein [Actomonas aquatica]|uniref:Uncharacterized protein n=1 Tax=Actomonas aquatica TaxID=2866162 RepID=A0ABZ1C880_9BACT|nr:hypothetical protein [Opitutus sp. WL0086]WRQ86754.1 hypothetical protein K1X11_018230 [Opitutus sp. WL0086]
MNLAAMGPETTLLLPRVLVTLATLAYAVGPLIVDMNRTHLLHPAWSGHARYHLMWSTLGQLGVGLVALWLTWSTDGSGDAVGRLRLAIVLGGCFNVGFWGALVLRRRFGGTLSDPGGVPAWRGIDGNLVACALIGGLLIAAWWLT